MSTNVYRFKTTNRLAYIAVMLAALAIAVGVAVITHYFFTPDEPLRFKRYLAIPLIITAIVLSPLVLAIKKKLDQSTEFELTASGDMVYYKTDNKTKQRTELWREQHSKLGSYFFYEAPNNYFIVFYFIGDHKPVELLLSTTAPNDAEYYRLKEDFSKISLSFQEETVNYKGHSVLLQKLV
jgi:hypothetical protein